MQYIGALEAAEKHISAKTFKANLHTSVKIQCNDLCRTLQKKSCRSAQIRKDRKPGYRTIFSPPCFQTLQTVNVSAKNQIT